VESAQLRSLDVNFFPRFAFRFHFHLTVTSPSWGLPRIITSSNWLWPCCNILTLI
jgi:hypothetical protein